MKDFESEMTKFAKHIRETAMKSDTAFEDTVEAFKSLTAYYGMLLKQRKGNHDEDEDQPNFANFGKHFEEHGNGRKKPV